MEVPILPQVEIHWKDTIDMKGFRFMTEKGEEYNLLQSQQIGDMGPLLPCYKRYKNQPWAVHVTQKEAGHHSHGRRKPNQ